MRKPKLDESLVGEDGIRKSDKKLKELLEINAVKCTPVKLDQLELVPVLGSGQSRPLMLPLSKSPMFHEYGLCSSLRARCFMTKLTLLLLPDRRSVGKPLRKSVIESCGAIIGSRREQVAICLFHL